MDSWLNESMELEVQTFFFEEFGKPKKGEFLETFSFNNGKVMELLPLLAGKANMNRDKRPLPSLPFLNGLLWR